MEIEITFRIALLALFVVFVWHRNYYTKKNSKLEERTLEVKEEGATEKVAAWLALPALLATAVYIFVPHWIAWSALPLPIWLRWGGVGLALMGFGLLQWSHHALSQNWSDTPRFMKEQTLITSGPYHWIRHPIYTAFLLIFIATLFISANWFIGAFWIGLTTIDIFSRVKFEESLLEACFGEAYRDYIKQTGRLLPKLF